jgi:hypothetical protein
MLLICKNEIYFDTGKEIRRLALGFAKSLAYSQSLWIWLLCDFHLWTQRSRLHFCPFLNIMFFFSSHLWAKMSELWVKLPFGNE